MPNILSVARIILSVLLLAIEPATVLFYVIYFACGLTDALDGFLARQMNAVSKLGKTLDTVGDAFFTLAILFLLFRLFEVPMGIIVWVAAIALVRVVAYLISYLRLRFVFTHTYLDRTAGIVMFLLLPVLLLFNLDLALVGGIVCAVASLATLELLAMSVLMKESRTDVYSIYQATQLYRLQ